MEPLADALLGLEKQLMDPALRASQPEAIAALLADEFVEFGASGRRYDRQKVLAAVAAEAPRRFEIDEFRALEIAPGCALVTYRVTAQPGSVESLRSSVWLQRDGRWQMVFHQGTIASAP